MDLHHHQLVNTARELKNNSYSIIEMAIMNNWMRCNIIFWPDAPEVSYYFYCCFLFVQLLFKGGIYFIGKACIYKSQMNMVHVHTGNKARPTTMEQFAPLGIHSTSLQLNTLWWLIDTGNSSCSLSVLLSAVETSCKTQIALAQSWWSPMPNTWLCWACYPQLLFEGAIGFAQTYQSCGNYWSTASDRRNV